MSSVGARNHSEHRSPLTLRWQRSRRRQLSAWRRLRISATGLLDSQQAGQPIDGERITEWRASEAYERARLECPPGMDGLHVREGAFTCTCDGVSIAPDVPGTTCDYFDEALLEPRANDGQPSGGDWVPEGWDGVEADRHEERAKLERERIEREKQDDLTHASEKIWVILRLVLGASPPVAALPTFATAV